VAPAPPGQAGPQCFHRAAWARNRRRLQQGVVGGPLNYLQIDNHLASVGVNPPRADVNVSLSDVSVGLLVAYRRGSAPPALTEEAQLIDGNTA
jgi:hypothetical protein